MANITCVLDDSEKGSIYHVDLHQPLILNTKFIESILIFVLRKYRTETKMQFIDPQLDRRTSFKTLSGLLDWIQGLDSWTWTGLVDWTHGLGLDPGPRLMDLDWPCGLDSWTLTGSRAWTHGHGLASSTELMAWTHGLGLASWTGLIDLDWPCGLDSWTWTGLVD
jgi:hypothetical protein